MNERENNDDLEEDFNIEDHYLVIKMINMSKQTLRMKILNV